jgi:hypothetical protein
MTIYEHLGFQQSIKYFPVQKLIPQLAIEGHNIAILPGTPWFNEQGLHPDASHVLSKTIS